MTSTLAAVVPRFTQCPGREIDPHLSGLVASDNGSIHGIASTGRGVTCAPTLRAVSVTRSAMADH